MQNVEERNAISIYEVKSFVKSLVEENNLVHIRKFEVKPLDPSKLHPDTRTVWKCRFGCNYYGKRKSCPPFVPEVEEVTSFLRSYRQAFLITVEYADGKYMETKKEIQELLVKIEGKLLNRFPLAFTVFPGGCDLCDECGFPDYEYCRARPTVSSIGIKVSDFGIEIGDKKLVSILLVD
jgi:predicted metal-binding protein